MKADIVPISKESLSKEGPAQVGHTQKNKETHQQIKNKKNDNMTLF